MIKKINSDHRHPLAFPRAFQLAGGNLAWIMAVVSGLLLSGCFPDTEWSWLSWGCLSPFLLALAGASSGAAFRLGIIFGMSHFFTLLYWIIPFLYEFAGLAYIVAVPVHVIFSFVLSLFPAAVSWLMVKSRLGAVEALCLFPFFWVSSEFCRMYVLSGFPWELLGYSQYRQIEWIQCADIFGVYGISFLVAASNGVITLLILSINRLPWQGSKVRLSVAVAVCCLTGALFGWNWGYGRAQLSVIGQKDIPVARVGIVQGNVDQAIKWDADQQAATLTKYLGLSHSLLKDQPDVIIWPETAAPFYFPFDQALTDIVIAGVRHAGTAFLVGAPSVWQEARDLAYYNSAFLLDSKGEIKGRYDKVHLVPFGEYVPAWLPFVKKIVAEVGDFKTGQPGRVLTADRIQIGTLICYEGIFPDLARKMTLSGANLLVNMTNDAWYGRSSAPYQHFSHSVFRAIENRRAIVRAANTGVSAYIEATGRILETTGIFEDAALVRPVGLERVETFYTHHGDIFAWGCLILSFSIFLWIFWHRRRSGAGIHR